MKENKKYIVYITINLVNNKQYIGVHMVTNPNTTQFDGYIGCGVYTNRPATYKNGGTPFKFAVKKYGIKNFKRITIREFENEEDAYQLEKDLVDEVYIKREDTYNLILGGRYNTNHANQYVKVYMYDIDGNYIREFETVSEATRFLNPKRINGGHIPRSIRNGNLCYGYQFSYEKVEFMKKVKQINRIYHSNLRETKPVGRYDVNGNLLETFEGMTECVKAGYSNAKKVVLGQREKCKGFIFKYL